jgi:LCP family protein required for cell wall assembly
MSEGSDPKKPPEYRVYGSGRRSPKAPRTAPSQRGSGAPEYRVYRARPRVLLARLRGEEDSLDEPRRGADSASPPRTGRRVTPLRVLAYALLALAGWLLVSLVLFIVSAQIEQSNVSRRAKAALSGGGTLPFSANTVLVLGSDQRLKGSKEPGANVGGPSRSDTILLMRVGGGKSAKLSIPRDTDVNIPGRGLGRINSAYNGGAALSIRTIESFLGIKINHLIEVNFKNFPGFIDSLGGVTVKTGCVLSLINGGTRNGGYTLHLRTGKHHLSGTQEQVPRPRERERPHPRQAPAADPVRVEGTAHVAVGLLPPPLGFLDRPQGRPLGHGRVLAARARRRRPHEQVGQAGRAARDSQRVRRRPARDESRGQAPRCGPLPQGLTGPAPPGAAGRPRAPEASAVPNRIRRSPAIAARPILSS